MKYCKYCLQPDTRPNTYFTDGVCPACIYFSEYKKVDWDERREILFGIADQYRGKQGQYDCIIGVSGGKDSSRQAIWVRDYLKLRPLLICLSYPPNQATDRGMENFSNLIELGFDVIQSAPAPETWRKLMAAAFDKYANWAKSTELALFSAVPQLAIRYRIPLIFWGENPGLQLGDMKTLGRTGYDGNNLRHLNTLSGGSNDWMREAGFTDRELSAYTYPSTAEFDAHGIQIVYLGWFLGDWSLLNNGMVASTNGLAMRSDVAENTGDLYGVTSLDEDWVTLNQMIKYYKFGFGRASDYVNEMIRMGTMTREQGIECVKRYDGRCGEKYIQDFCQFIGIDVSDFWDKIRSVTNPDLFDVKGNLAPKFEVGVGLQ